MRGLVRSNAEKAIIRNLEVFLQKIQSCGLTDKCSVIFDERCFLVFI